MKKFLEFYLNNHEREQNSNLQIPKFRQEQSPKSSALQKTAACTLFSKSSLAECYSNLLKIESFMAIESYMQDQVMIAPYSEGEQSLFVSKQGLGFAMGAPMTSSMVTAAPVIKKILTDPTSTEGLRKAAIKMLELQKKKMTTNSNLFDDLRNSYIEAGLSKSEAEVKTWDSLGALAATGPNFAKRWSRHSSPIHGQKMNLKNIDDNPNAYLLQIIAEAIPKLDSQKSIHKKARYIACPRVFLLNATSEKPIIFG